MGPKLFREVLVILIAILGLTLIAIPAAQEDYGTELSTERTVDILNLGLLKAQKSNDPQLEYSGVLNRGVSKNDTLIAVAYLVEAGYIR
jgi:hypothetical protein